MDGNANQVQNLSNMQPCQVKIGAQNSANYGRRKMSLQIFLGPMFAGKSSTILRIVNRYKAIGRKMCVITYAGDNRYSAEDILMNHDAMGIPCKKTELLRTVTEHADFQAAQLIIIDEAQFFRDLRDVVRHCVDGLRKDVVIVGLDGDADRKPFGQVLECIPLADEVTKLKAFCRDCGDGTEAIFTYCNQRKDEQVVVGGAEMYESLCRKHYLAKYFTTPCIHCNTHCISPS
jgi:thymidine kinase